MLQVHDVVEYMGSEWVVDKVNDNSAILRNPSIHHDKRCIAFKQLKLIESVSPQKEAELKQCSECREVKPLDDFQNHRKGTKKKMCSQCNQQKLKAGKGKQLSMKQNEREMTSAVHSPTHYQGRLGLEAIEVHRNFMTSEQMTGYHLGNTLKYLLRYQNKNGLEDLKKAKVHLDWLIEEVAK